MNRAGKVSGLLPLGSVSEASKPWERTSIRWRQVIHQVVFQKSLSGETGTDVVAFNPEVGAEASDYL